MEGLVVWRCGSAGGLEGDWTIGGGQWCMGIWTGVLGLMGLGRIPVVLYRDFLHCRSVRSRLVR